MANRTPQTFTDAIKKFMNVSVDLKVKLRRSYDDWAFKQIWADKMKEASNRSQKANFSEHVRLGPDLAVAHFVLRTRGRIIDSRGKWIARRKDLPPDYSKAFKLTSIDLSRSVLFSEAMDNLVGLEELEYLNLSSNPQLDDFACDQLSRQFRNSKTLKEIDLSYNPRISIYGIETLLRIPTLSQIYAVGTGASSHEEIDLLTLAAQDECGCDIFAHKDGKQFINDELEEVRFNKQTNLSIDK